LTLNSAPWSSMGHPSLCQGTATSGRLLMLWVDTAVSVLHNNIPKWGRILIPAVAELPRPWVEDLSYPKNIFSTQFSTHFSPLNSLDVPQEKKIDWDLRLVIYCILACLLLSRGNLKEIITHSVICHKCTNTHFGLVRFVARAAKKKLANFIPRLGRLLCTYCVPPSGSCRVSAEGFAVSSDRLRQYPSCRSFIRKR
jgi:hypothetical protein